ncbi:MAG TPA: OmpH family outer membrane protein [Thermoanaerobaculia bacterium]|nr:OmpH family outer membrane protein [Thermoanaerobaculia bacterium]
MVRILRNNVLLAALHVAVLPLMMAPALAAQQAPLRVAVIDSDRIVAESIRGKAALERLKKVQDEKLAEGRRLQQEITELRKRIDEGQHSLAPEKLAELKKQYEDRLIAFRRFSDDADRDLGKQRDDVLQDIEKDALAIIDAYGKERGYTLILNKYRSGLVYADETVDITDEIIQRFDAVRTQ